MTVIAETLWIENGDGAAVAHRVVLAGPVRLAMVHGRRQRAVPIRVIGAGPEPRLVPQSDLTPAAALSPAEEREYQRLDRELAGTMGDARKLKRLNGLRLRWLLFGGEA